MNDPKTVAFKAYRLMQGQHRVHREVLSCVNHYETVERADAARDAIQAKSLPQAIRDMIFAVDKLYVPTTYGGFALYEKSPWYYQLIS